jgi:hypothetical protein
MICIVESERIAANRRLCQLALLAWRYHVAKGITVVVAIKLHCLLGLIIMWLAAH